MGIKVYPTVSSAIKSIQRGSTTSSGTITISAVDTTKSFVNSFSNGSAGTVATDSSESGTLNPSGGNVGTGGNGAGGGGSFPNFIGTRSLSGGSTSLTSASYGVTLTNSTTLTATGACRWEVIEYY